MNSKSHIIVQSVGTEAQQVDNGLCVRSGLIGRRVKALMYRLMH